MATEEKVRKSIMPEGYKTKPADWLGTFVDGEVKTVIMKDKTTKTKDEDGTEIVKVENVSTGKSALDLDKLFALCKANAIDTTKMEAQRENKNAPGRIRMTLGNNLRAAARHRHGLFNLAGEWVDAPADFVGETARTQERDGTKIKIEKPAAAPAEAA